MSAREDGERLRTLGGSEDIPVEPLRRIQGKLLDVNAEVITTLGHGHPGNQVIIGAIELLNASLEDAIISALLVETIILDFADMIDPPS